MYHSSKAYYVLIGFFCFITNVIIGQDQKLADSLINIYQNGPDQENALVILRKIAEQETNPNRQLHYAKLLIELASKDSLFDFLHSGYLQMGYAMHDKGSYESALEYFFESINYASRIDYSNGVGAATISIADVYSEMGNADNAEIYYDKGINILRKNDDLVSLATALLNAGDDAYNNEKYSIALKYFEESSQIFENIDYLIGSAYNKGNIGMVLAKQGKDSLAKTSINDAIKILENLEDHNAISEYLIYMSDIYSRQNDLPTALGYAKRSLELATLYRLKDKISEANLKLSALYDKAGNLETAYKHFKDHITYRDSVKNIEVVQQMANQRTNYEVSQKQIEIDLAEQREKNQRNIAIATAIALFLIGLLAIGLFRRNTFIRRTKKIIEEERDRSDNLLLNILPEETAAELKANGSVKAKKYDAVTVMFTDFLGFTSFSEKLSPEALVETVGFYFSEFDAIVEKHGLEKIKTIGDAYMCAGGLHGSEENHPQKMVLAATEMAQFIHDTKHDSTASTMNFDVRIGINTGPVVAGVVGTKKFAYDIWGDTVNVASRMESMSEPGRINISNSTYQHIKSDFECEYRGEIEAKNKGKIKMYFVNTPMAP